jgi:hypothetical protein
MPRTSLNEIEAMGRKAARGAGMSWGLAEEAGKAVRWLALNGRPGLAALVRLLEGQDGTPYERLRPHVEEAAGNPLWRAGGGTLCPIAAGAALADLAAEIGAPPGIALERVAEPLLLLPFLARAARYEGRAFALEAGGETVPLYPDGPAGGPVPTLEGAMPARVFAWTAERNSPPPEQSVRGVAVEDELWTRAGRFAERTYVPASDASRLSGAGAGLTDND